MYRKEIGTPLRHDGISYLNFMAILSQQLRCRNYFEIGTAAGHSLRAFRCDAVCVDPRFKISQDVLQGRRRAHFFQMTSDAFFNHYNLRAFLPGGVDVAFLDGLHHFEALLRDFINTERFCHDRSVILLHDCLPLNERMAERTFREDAAEGEDTRISWTGDVWRLLPILQKYRPDLRVQQFDCGPTGLIACTGLAPYSRVLLDDFDAIVKEFSDVSLSSFGLMRLWKLFPTLDTRRLAAAPADVPKLLFGDWTEPVLGARAPESS